MTTCDKCGAEYGIGAWPFCKGGHGEPSLVMVAHGEIVRKHLGGREPMRFGSLAEEDRYLKSRGLVRLADVPETEGERNALERARERKAREAEGRPDKINPLPESEMP